MELMDTAADEGFLLELLNSTPIADGEQHDELGTARAGRSWLRAHGLSGSPEQWRAVRAARSALQAVVRGEQPADTLAPHLEGVSRQPSVSADGVRWRLEGPAERAAAARAVLAWDALRRTRPGRLRPCENAECALFLIDRSKPNRGRWCSMAVCGNRMKARRHYERSRDNVES